MSLNPQPVEVFDWQIDVMAYHLFRFNMEDYDAEEGTILIAWSDPDIREFWVKQSRAMVDFLNGAILSPPPAE